jgi:N utilization substance protein B
MPGDRHQARILAMQALCQWDVQGDQSQQALDEFVSAQGIPSGAAPYAVGLVGGFWARQKGIDERISAAATKWDLSRLSPVERNTIRVAIVELLEKKVPPKVALDEAIEIGREFGGQDSARFINGVLDAILKNLPEEEKGER